MKSLITNRDLYEELQVSKKEKKELKLRAQVKSRFYYIFWGAATLSVFAGQLYVGSGYRQMSRSFNRIMNTIVIELDDEVRHPMMAPQHIPEYDWEEDGLWHPTDPPQRI